MTYPIRTRDEHYKNDGTPKRILALDGGGLRGIVSLAILQKVEDILRERHGGDEGFRLSHYFDLIAGTSTGAIIAATLALGWRVEDLRAKYMELGSRVFEPSFLRQGLLRAKYDEGRLINELQSVYGRDTTLGSQKLETGLLVVTKRMDTGSYWPIGNNPRGKYFGPRDNGTIANSEYPLWQVVRASTAAPSFFDPEHIVIAEGKNGAKVDGVFADGGMSPFNNPALMSVMYATLDGYRVGWPTGADKLLVLSVGTGRADPSVKRAKLPAEQALRGLAALMDDTAALQEIMMQWLSHSPTAREIDRELGDLRNDSIAASPLVTYLRYNVDLAEDQVRKLNPELRDPEVIESLSAMDTPANMNTLHRLGALAADRDVRNADFPSWFDLPQG